MGSVIRRNLIKGKKMNINTVDYWNKKHKEVAVDNRYINVMERIYHNFILDRVEGGKKLIDIGCGKGLFIENLIKTKITFFFINIIKYSRFGYKFS